MKHSILVVCASLLFLSVIASAQQSGRLIVTARTAPNSENPAAPAMDAKVIVVHWTNSGFHPTLFQDQIATTNQMGMCTIDLAPGAYDVFISANGLEPAAFHRDISPGVNTNLTATLKSAPLHLRPIQ